MSNIVDIVCVKVTINYYKLYTPCVTCYNIIYSSVAQVIYLLTTKIAVTSNFIKSLNILLALITLKKRIMTHNTRLYTPSVPKNRVPYTLRI